MEDVSGFYPASLVLAMLYGKVLSGLYVTSGPEQSGKCVSGDTFVNTNDGFMCMSDLITKDGLNPVKNKLIATHRGFKKVSHTYKGKSDTYSFVTSFGRKLRATPNHPVLVLTEDLRHVWRRMDRLQEGDWVACNKNSEARFGKRKVSFDMATILGNFTANGHEVQLSSQDPLVIDRFHRAVENETGQPPSVIYTKDGKIAYHNVLAGGQGSKDGNFFDVMADYGYTAKCAAEKEIPESILTAPQEILHEFLESYFDCDCGIDGNTIKLCSASERLIDQLQVILLQVYGIRSSKRSTRNMAHNSNTPTVRTYYNLSISGADKTLFLESFERAKAHNHEHVKNKQLHEGYLKVIPYVRKLTKEAFELARVSDDKCDSRVKDVNGNIFNNFARPYYITSSDSGKSNVPHATMGLFYKVNWDEYLPKLHLIAPILADRIDALLNMDLTYEQIVNIKYHKKPIDVYDVTVPDTHAFITNGIVSHNSSMMATVLGQSFAAGTLICKHYDVERAMRSSYMGRIVADHAGVSWEELSKRVTKGDKVVEHPRYRWLLESSLEDVFAEITNYLTILPDKIYISETKTWRLVFDDYPDTKDGPNVPKEHKALHAKVAAILPLDSRMSDKRSRYYDVGDDASFQAFYAIDSVKALTLKSVEAGKKGFHQPGIMAKALSDHLPYVKGLLRRKHAVLWCINQMYVNPMEKYGDPNYETAGNALKLHSDVRVLAKPASSVPEPFTKTKGKQGVCTEPSVLGNGSDEYTFKNLKNIKNKFAETPYLGGSLRIWSSGPHFRPGIDPVYDVASFLHMIGLAQFGVKGKSAVVKLADDDALEEYAGANILWADFKSEILAEVGLGKGKPGSLHEICWELLESGKAHEIYQNAGDVGAGVAVNHLADADDD
jgi:intein/homing endonuclease